MINRPPLSIARCLLSFSPPSPFDTTQRRNLVRGRSPVGDNDNRGGSPAASPILRQEAVDNALHAAVQNQEAKCYLSQTRNSCRRVSFRLPGSDGSNYPRPPLSVSSTTPLCTNPGRHLQSLTEAPRLQANQRSVFAIPSNQSRMKKSLLRTLP